MPKILIADEHPVVREGVKKILSEALSDVHFGEASDGQEAVDLCRTNNWDLVVLDLVPRDKSGFEVLSEFRQQGRRIPVLILTVQTGPLYARQALRLGAAGYLSKLSIPDDLVRAVRRILAGGRYIDGALTEAIATGFGWKGEEALTKLSNREHQVMCLIGCGKTMKQVAEQLSLSPRTVSTYRTHILEKMHLRSTAELILYSVQYGLVNECLRQGKCC